MSTFQPPFTPKNAEKYVCINCNFKCSKQSNFDIHLNTTKHKKIHLNTKLFNTMSKYSCFNCGKEYKYHSGLWRHKQLCHVMKDDNIIPHPIDSTLLGELLQQNKELHNMVIELVKNNNTTNNI